MRRALFDPGEEAGLAVLDDLATQEAALFAARAQQLHDCAALSDRLHGTDGIERFLLIDIAGTLRIGQLAAARRLAEAQRLVLALPRTLDGLRTGAVLVPQAVLVLEETDACSEPVAAEVDDRLHTSIAPDGLAGWTGRRLRGRLKRLVLAVEAELDPAATQERERTARARRRVSVQPEPDGMASLWALFPAQQARTFALGLDELTRRQGLVDAGCGKQRSADQRRADVLASLPAIALHSLDALPRLGLDLDALPALADPGTERGDRPADRTDSDPGSDSPGSGTGPALPTGLCSGLCTHPSVILNVHVPVATLHDLSAAPGELDGYGPISAEHVRILLPNAQLRRVLVDETTGEPLAADARTTGPSRQLRRRDARAAAQRDRQLPKDPTSGARTEEQRCDKPGDGPGTRREDRKRAGTVPPPTSEPPAVNPARAEPDVQRGRILALLPDQPVLVDETPEPQHDPSAALARFVMLRDPLCTAPGCATSSRRCDLDHELPWPLGPTAARNLRPRSRRCHRAKTLSWSVRRTVNAGFRWTSPTGRSYSVPPAWDPPPAPRVPPATPRAHHPRPPGHLDAPATGVAPAGSAAVSLAPLTEELDRAEEMDRRAGSSGGPAKAAGTGWDDEPEF